MEEVLKRGLEGGIAVGGSRFWTLAYADEIVVIAREEEVLRSMMKRLEKYLEERKPTLNAEKSKVMVFDKQRKKREEREWVWKGEKIEEVKEFIYLGFLLRKNGDVKGHVRERVKRATIIMKKVWGIGKKIFKDDFKRRMRLYDTLVASVLLYRVEIWGWKEYEEIERLQERYIRWTLGLDRCTPWYIVLKEGDRERMKIRTGNRACKFENYCTCEMWEHRRME